MKIDNKITPVGSTVAVLSSDNTKVTITCKDGFTFENAPIVTYEGDDPFADAYHDNAILSSDKKSATCTFQDKVSSDTVTITGTAKVSAPTPTPPTVNNHVENTTVTTSYEDGKVTITITNGYNSTTRRLQNVKAKYTENGTPKTVDFNYSVNEQNRTVATATFAVGSGISIDVTGENTHVIEIHKTLNNCTGNVPDTCMIGDTIDITLTAKSGTEFQICTLSIAGPFGDVVNEIKNVVTISSDKKTATIHYTINDDIDGLIVYGNCVVVSPVGGNYGAVNVYVVTDENLKAFSKVRFESASNGVVKYYDLGKYVNCIKRIFTNVENGANDILKCANYNTQISVHQPKSDKIMLDFGTVTITEHNKDNTDYESNIQLFVPFAGLVSIPNEYIGKEIHLYIDINVITGSGLYRLMCDDIQFHMGECTPSIDVLYRTSGDNQIGGDTWNENLFMGLEPYIILKWYESKNPDGRNNDLKRGKISSFTGYNSFDSIVIQPTVNMLAREQEMIYTTMLKGVYVE